MGISILELFTFLRTHENTLHSLRLRSIQDRATESQLLLPCFDGSDRLDIVEDEDLSLLVLRAVRRKWPDCRLYGWYHLYDGYSEP